MSVFLVLLAKIIPLYLNLILGFVAGKWLHVQRESIATLVIYIVAPLVFFGGIVRMELTPALLAMPLLGFLLALCVCLVSYRVTRSLYSDARPNIMAAAAGNGNTGYFGLPIAMAMFDEQTVGVYLLLSIGITIHESTVGFYLSAKGHHTPAEAFRKTVRLPLIYALLAAVLVNFSGVELPGLVKEFLHYFQGAYTVLGMMIIGLALSGLAGFAIDAAFTLLLFAARFALWPLLAFCAVWADRQWFGLYDEPIYRAVTLISFMPLAANSAAVAALLRCEPEKVATAVLLSTLFAAFYVPFMVTLFLK